MRAQPTLCRSNPFGYELAVDQLVPSKLDLGRLSESDKPLKILLAVLPHFASISQHGRVTLSQPYDFYPPKFI